jgi:hypothetical protein
MRLIGGEGMKLYVGNRVRVESESTERSPRTGVIEEVIVTDVNDRPARVHLSEPRSREILEGYLASDAPRPGTGPSTVGRRIGSLAWVVDYDEAGQIEALVVDREPRLALATRTAIARAADRCSIRPQATAIPSAEIPSSSPEPAASDTAGPR